MWVEKSDSLTFDFKMLYSVFDVKYCQTCATWKCITNLTKPKKDQSVATYQGIQGGIVCGYVRVVLHLVCIVWEVA